MAEPPEVRCSVVIPCLNGGATLAGQLDALVAQDSPVRFEVVVADNGSTDDSRDVARRYAPLVRVVEAPPRSGINVARNAGIAASTGELLLFCDADDIVHPGWLRSYWDAYATGSVLLGGSLRRVTADGALIGWQRHLNDDLGFLPWPTGANCGLARSVLQEVGEFDESLRGGGDETDLFWRAQLRGHRLVEVPGAAIDYVARSDRRSAFRQSTAYGRSHTVLFSRFRSAGMPRSNPARSAVRWVRLLRALVRSGFANPDVLRLVRYSGILWGRMRGSAGHRCFYV